jgi:hypothetical protein
MLMKHAPKIPIALSTPPGPALDMAATERRPELHVSGVEGEAFEHNLLVYN